MEIAGWILAVALMLVGLAGTVLPMLPGLPFLFGGMWLAAGLDQYQHVGSTTLVILGVLLAIGIALDYVAGALGAKKVGASKAAIWGSVIGSIAGVFFGIAGMLIGPFAGAAAGEFLTGRDLYQAGKVGIATWVGMVVAAIAKVGIAVMMLGVFALAWLF
ncbi:hypothetical protein IGB42_01416 [Andreprevotia sp. IGB-42]|uniref:DUF456 domain-containing protein n=1 Tax=Andreprevotia sp. IGB-42 TaxID=2497473 RepID=UPI00135AF218|nr:DUF456 family protein [Andreprevotia sp. IGB-42]KAF0813737.1 hypothetical protein IGB42_01416 [Andreprevotia sp. IGB-42]